MRVSTPGSPCVPGSERKSPFRIAICSWTVSSLTAPWTQALSMMTCTTIGRCHSFAGRYWVPGVVEEVEQSVRLRGG
jgi:hypothetical protein